MHSCSGRAILQGASAQVIGSRRPAGAESLVGRRTMARPPYRPNMKPITTALTKISKESFDEIYDIFHLHVLKNKKLEILNKHLCAAAPRTDLLIDFLEGFRLTKTNTPPIYSEVEKIIQEERRRRAEEEETKKKERLRQFTSEDLGLLSTARHRARSSAFRDSASQAGPGEVVLLLRSCFPHDLAAVQRLTLAGWFSGRAVR